MFYKVGFYFLLILVIVFIGIFLKTNPMKNQGALSWVDFYSNNPTATIKFLNDNFDIRVAKTQKTPTGQDYNIIKARGQMWPFAGIMETPILPDGTRAPAGTTVYLTVKDYDVAHVKAIESGAIPFATGMVTDGMRFGFYKIPGDVGIALVQYENVKSEK